MWPAIAGERRGDVWSLATSAPEAHGRAGRPRFPTTPLVTHVPLRAKNRSHGGREEWKIMRGKSNLGVHVYTAARLLCGGKNALWLAAACTDKHFRPAEFLPRGICIRSQVCVLGIKPHDVRLRSSADFRQAGLLRSGDAPNFGSWSRLGQPRSSGRNWKAP